MMLSKWMPFEVGAPVRHRLLVEGAQRLAAGPRASTPARSSWPRCHAPPPRTARAARWRPRRRSRTSRSRTGPARRWPASWVSCVSGVAVMSTLLACSWWLRRGLCAEALLACQCCLGERDVRGARAVAVDDRRQPLHVGAQDLGEGLPLGFAQLRELLGHMRHRAVMLAELDAVDRPAHRCRGGRVAGLGQRPGHPVGSRFNVVGAVGYSRQDACRYGAARRCGRRRRRRSPAAAASRQPRGRRRCGPAWPCPAAVSRYRFAGRPRPLCCQAAAALDCASPASNSASRCLRTPAAEMPSRSPISPAVMGPDSSKSWTIAPRVWRSRLPPDGIFTTPL